MLETKPTCIRLDRAYLCLDCETIGDDTRKCVNCQSIAIFPLARFLNRESNGSSKFIYVPKILEDVAHTCIDQPNLSCPACTRAEEIKSI